MNQRKIDRRQFFRGVAAPGVFLGMSMLWQVARAASCPKLPKPKHSRERVPFQIKSELGQTFSGVMDLASVERTPDTKLPDLLSVDLLLDGLRTETPVDVIADQIVMLSLVNPELHRPETALFSWGKKFSFTGTIEQVHVGYTAFLPNGAPVRATVNVTLRREQSCDLPPVK